jgi:methylisocitrate lyase
MLKPPPSSPGQILRDLFAQGTVLMPGVFNAISAVSATAAGSKALYLSGAGLTNGTLGVPDIALASQT